MRRSCRLIWRTLNRWVAEAPFLTSDDVVEQAELQQIQAQPNKVVSCGDVWEMLKSLGAKTSKVCLRVLCAWWCFNEEADQ